MCKWFISSDIYGCFDAINHKKLILIMQESIEDQILMSICNKFFNLQMKGLKVGNLNRSKCGGLFLGNFFLPVLFHVYFNELDQFVLRLKIVDDKTDSFVMKKKIKVCFNVDGSQKMSEKKYCWLNYVRYVSDYLMAVRGSKQQAKKVKKRTEVFLKSSLHSALVTKDLMD